MYESMCCARRQRKEQLRVVLGTFALWFGWYGFNPGSTLSMHDKEMGALAAQVAMIYYSILYVI